MTLEEKYWELCNRPGDIREHLPILRAFASQCNTVVELGVRCGISTVALLMGATGKVYSYDVLDHDQMEPRMISPKPNWEFFIGDSTRIKIPPCELLFIDTLHTGKQLEKELFLHQLMVSRWIILHDTDTFGKNGEDGGEGLMEPVRLFTRAHPWRILLDLKNNNGLTVMERKLC